MLVLTSLLFVFILLYRCHFGIDLTDEGLYLNLISNPWLYKISVSQFGYIYHPLYQLVGENIVRLRQADMLIMLGLAWIVCTQLLFFVLTNPKKTTTYPNAYIYGLSFALATCVFTFFGVYWWIPTPSYNSLTLEGLLVIAIALLNLPLKKNHVMSSCILGVGGWLTFMGKPTSAVCIGLIALLYILAIRSNTCKKVPFLLRSLLVFLGCFITSAWIIAGSPYDFIVGLHHAAKEAALIDGAFFNYLFAIFPLPDQYTKLIFITLFVPFFLSLNLSPLSQSKAHIGFIYAVLILNMLICLNMLYLVPFNWNSHTLNGVLIGIIPLAIGLTFILMDHKSFRTPETINALILALFFISLPYAFASGTHFDEWYSALRMGLFIALSAIPLIACLKYSHAVYWRMLLIVVVTSQLISFSLVQLCMEHPYRQTQPLHAQTKTIDVINTQGRVTSQLIVSDTMANYINTLKDTAIKHGFQHGDAMIDLTGISPTTLYLLGAKAIGSPWYLGGFSGSIDLAISTFLRIPCDELTSAWVLESVHITEEKYNPRLFEPHGKEGYNPKLLEPHGMDIASFQALPPVIDARGFGQQLLKPIRPHDKSIKMCEERRKQLRQSQHELQKITKKDLPLSGEIINLSQTYLAENKINQAITLLNNATQLNPSNPIFYNNLCFAYAIHKEYDAAIQACSQALQLDPNFQLAKNNLAWATQEKTHALNK